LKTKKMNMRDLIRLMKALDREVANCSRCGICQSVCPLYAVTGDESDVARGKIMLLSGLMTSFFENPHGVRQRLDRCLLCGACAAACPRGVNTLELFLTARGIIAGYEGLSLVKKLIFRRILSNPRVFDRVMEWASRWQSLVLKKSDIPAGSCGTLVSPLLSHRHLAPLAMVPFHKMLPEQTQLPGRSGMRVAFFVGCLLDKVFPKVAIDIGRVLTAHGFQVIIPPDQGCCGIPALAAGDQASFQRLASHNLDRFDPLTFDFLVTGCATCTAAIKKIWPAMVNAASPDQSAAVARISEKTYDVMQFLVEVAGVRPSGQEREIVGGPIITYHDPCHLRKTLNISSQPRIVLSASGAGRFVEMPDAGSCCGMGGSFNLAHYDLSTAIGEKKVACIEASGASIVATGCPACMIQLADMLARQKDHVQVVHVMELYAENILESAPGPK